MTAFSLLLSQQRAALAILLFAAAIAQLLLCLYEAVCGSSLPRRAANGALLLALTALLAVLTTRQPACPWALVPLLAAAVFSHAVLSARQERRRRRERLSPASVRQALDGIDTGVCFADETGRIVLINGAMAALALSLSGRYPQMLSELQSAFEAAEPPEGEPSARRCPDGTVRRVINSGLRAPALAGYRQMTAQDITDLVAVNEGLARENETLRETNEHLRQTYERLADRIREQEMLNLKMRIHDEIGASLLALSGLIEGGLDGDGSEQLQVLQNAIGYFSGRHERPAEDSLEAVRRRAKALHIALCVEGELPEDRTARQLVCLAARECLTNCAKHAKGDCVTLALSQTEDACIAVLTNTGAPPQGDVIEGGGLSALRARVLRAGGAMEIEAAPRFLLRLKLPKEGFT